MNKLEALRELPIFEAVPEEVIEPLAGYFIVKEFERGDALWKEGQEAKNFTFIVEGKVKVTKYLPDGRETILGVFDEGDAVGQIAVYRRIRFPASCVALDDTVVVEIYRDHFYGTLARHTDLLEAVINGMMKRNFDLVRRVQELSTSSAEQRLAMLFEKFATKVGRRTRLENDEMGVYIDLPLSRADISDLINTRVETAIRIMSRWNKEGPVRTEKTGFLVTDYDELQRIALGEE